MPDRPSAWPPSSTWWDFASSFFYMLLEPLHWLPPLLDVSLTPNNFVRLPSLTGRFHHILGSVTISWDFHPTWYLPDPSQAVNLWNSALGFCSLGKHFTTLGSNNCVPQHRHRWSPPSLCWGSDAACLATPPQRCSSPSLSLCLFMLGHLKIHHHISHLKFSCHPLEL